MVNDLPIQYRYSEMELNAYNAAFCELGFGWHWDRATYHQLLCQSADAAQQIRHYLETRQPHLLKAYDAEFLVGAIQATKTRHKAAYFNWTEPTSCELGI